MAGEGPSSFLALLSAMVVVFCRLDCPLGYSLQPRFADVALWAPDLASGLHFLGALIVDLALGSILQPHIANLAPRTPALQPHRRLGSPGPNFAILYS